MHDSPPRLRSSAPALALCLALGLSASDAAVLPVDTLLDVDTSDGACSLREALIAAETDTPYRDCPTGDGDDEVEITVAGTLTLVTPLPALETTVTLRGLGSDQSTLAGDSTFRLLELLGGPSATHERLRLESLHLTGGTADEGGAVAVRRNRTLEIVDCRLDGHHATVEGGAVFGEQTAAVSIVRTTLRGNTSAGAGGAVAVHGGTVEVEDSTVALNFAQGGNGGGIYALTASQLTIRRSTLSGNEATGDGGGISAVVTPATIASSTIVGNLTDSDDNDEGDGGGLGAAGPVTVTLFNTVLADNLDGTTAGIECPDGMEKLGADVVSSSSNLIGSNDCVDVGFPAGQPNLNGDLVGTATLPLASGVEPLAANGGPTDTHLPLAASLVVDGGACPGDAADQRGYGNRTTLLRWVDDPLVANAVVGCDIGAVELGAFDLSGLVFYDGFEGGGAERWSAAVP